MKRPLLPVLAVALMTAGCISTSNSEAVSQLSGDWRRDARVETVTLSRPDDLRVTPEFNALFTQRVKAKVDACATGQRPLRLEARLDKLTKANPFVTAILFGQNKVRGSARLVDVQTGQVVGEYVIGRTVTGSRVGVIQMAEAEEQLSDGFGAEICRQAFSVEPPPVAH
ncbi:MAG: hypothetical protein K1X35_10485 [Caulobacteraceae bacterium]|nr:hypothetical protein [Caulobacteraceae bacterium]